MSWIGIASFIPLDENFMKAEDLKTKDQSVDFLKSRLRISWRFHAFESTAWIFPLPREFDGLLKTGTQSRWYRSRDFIHSWERDELRGECGAKQIEGTWRLFLHLSQEIVAGSTKGEGIVGNDLGLPKIIKTFIQPWRNKDRMLGTEKVSLPLELNWLRLTTW